MGKGEDGATMRVECRHDRKRDDCHECDEEQARRDELRKIVREEVTRAMSWSPTGGCRICGGYAGHHLGSCIADPRGGGG